MKNLIGAVLCGGESKRMGTDKGLLPIKNSAWARHVADMFNTLRIPFVISVNNRQVNDYDKLFLLEQLVVDNEMKVLGPLKGLLSVHEQFPLMDLFLMACDMIDMKVSIMQKIIETYEADNSFDFYVYQHEGVTEPFAGIYTASGLKNVMQKASTNTLTGFSLQEILKNGSTKKLLMSNGTSFKNYNSPADLEAKS